MKAISRKRIFILLALLCLPYQWAFSQTIQNDVVASAGETYILENIEVSWTLGESITETYQHDNLLISQGFHQPLLIVTDIPDKQFPAINIWLFPNPTRDILQLELPEAGINDIYFLTILDINGKNILSENICHEDKYKLDFSQLHQGMYLLTIERKSDGGRSSFKIIKADN